MSAEVLQADNIDRRIFVSGHAFRQLLLYHQRGVEQRPVVEELLVVKLEFGGEAFARIGIHAFYIEDRIMQGGIVVGVHGVRVSDVPDFPSGKHLFKKEHQQFLVRTESALECTVEPERA